MGWVISHIPPLVGALRFEAVSYRCCRHTFLSETYIDASSDKVMNIESVPIHVRRYPYTSPAGPPLRKYSASTPSPVARFRFLLGKSHNEQAMVFQLGLSSSTRGLPHANTPSQVLSTMQPKPSMDIRPNCLYSGSALNVHASLSDTWDALSTPVFCPCGLDPRDLVRRTFAAEFADRLGSPPS